MQGAYIYFRILKKLSEAPFIIYGDFECVLMPSTDNIDFGPKLKIIEIISFIIMATN